MWSVTHHPARAACRTSFTSAMRALYIALSRSLSLITHTHTRTRPVINHRKNKLFIGWIPQRWCSRRSLWNSKKSIQHQLTGKVLSKLWINVHSELFRLLFNNVLNTSAQKTLFIHRSWRVSFFEMFGCSSNAFKCYFLFREHSKVTFQNV